MLSGSFRLSSDCCLFLLEVDGERLACENVYMGFALRLERVLCRIGKSNCKFFSFVGLLFVDRVGLEMADLSGLLSSGRNDRSRCGIDLRPLFFGDF